MPVEQELALPAASSLAGLSLTLLFAVFFTEIFYIQMKLTTFAELN